MATLVLITACGGGGTTGANASGDPAAAFGNLRLLGHSPADQAVQVAVDAELLLEFDGTVALESLADPDTWLRVVGTGAEVPGSFRAIGEHSIGFRPQTPLQPATDYRFQLAPLTCDHSGRILELEPTFTFRTYDVTPPQLVAVNVSNGQTGVARDAQFRFTFDEPLATASITAARCYVQDQFGHRYAAAVALDGLALTLQPFAELPGDRACHVVVKGSVTDRAGNALGQDQSRSFRTAADLTAPTVTEVWPALGSSGISPRIVPSIAFSESMDAGTVEPSSLLFQDEFGSMVAYSISSSPDQRRLEVVPHAPLLPNRSYTLAFLTGNAAATDVSGNPLAATQATQFAVGSDGTAPWVLSSAPANGATAVSPNALLQVTFDDPLDPAFVDGDRVLLTANGQPVHAVVELAWYDTTVKVTPVLPLAADTPYELRLLGGRDGLHDVAGNALPADHVVTLRSNSDTTLPVATMHPGDGNNNVPRGATVSILFATPIDPATVHTDTIEVTTDAGQPLDGTLQVDAGRLVRFLPAQPFAANTYYRARVVGGPAGVREHTGNWLDDDLTARFRAGMSFDLESPQVSVTLNQAAPARRENMVVPPYGFTIDVAASDPGGLLEQGAAEVLLTGPGPAPGAVSIRRSALTGPGTFRWIAPADAPLAAGDWTVTVRWPDQSGNAGTSAPLAFAVAAAGAEVLPFERTQVVWARTDLDRDGSGRADFDEDLIALGLMSATDPAGTNAYMRQLVLDGIFAQAYMLLHRGPRGQPLGPDSVPLRFTAREPVALAHMQMALGGLDPSGNRQRTFGDPSTGTLGRAYYDYRNGQVNERNISLSPGLGVFARELVLYQAEIHQQVYPSFLTLFAQRFLPLSPHMAGTPAGNHALDAQVLRADFDYATATVQQRARHNTVMAAADDWAIAIGIILAHEVGHSVGLVAPGPAPSGLYGDASLHDANSGAAEVMAATIGYEAMVTVPYAFRDVDLAYLRQRLLVR